MQEQFLNHIKNHELCTLQEPILVTVSGGVDSVVMLHLFREAGFTIGVAHCNFQLRGKESDGDEEFVRQLCLGLNVPFFFNRFETEAYAWENGISTQMAARELRYTWFDSLLEKHHYTRIATGHHFDDTIETIILNLTRGSSVEGLSGIPVKNNKIIRPLLFATRADVEKYAVEKGISWRTDQSNLTDDYQRNFIRHQVVPKLKELNPSLETTLHAGLEKLHGDVELIHAFVHDWRQQFLTQSNERITLEKKGFDGLKQGAHLLWRVIRDAGFNFEQCVEVIHGLNGQPGKRFLSPTHQLIIDRSQLIITPHVGHWNEVVIDQGQSSAVFAAMEISIERTYDFTVKTDSYEAVLDEAKLQFPLRLRRWKPGDFFFPLGMEHKRKLSDFLIDKKVSLADKDTVTVLESGGEIAWVIGYRIDNRFKITDQTRSALVFTVGSYFM
ncbi:MAG TPA: tRNA lysidine(34) synthetase TilS [Ohtaekwangia sp.]